MASERLIADSAGSIVSMPMALAAIIAPIMAMNSRGPGPRAGFSVSVIGFPQRTGERPAPAELSGTAQAQQRARSPRLDSGRLELPLHDFVRQLAVELGQMVEFRAVGGETLAQRTQLRIQALQLRFRQQCLDLVPPRPAFARCDAEHLATAARQGRADPRRRRTGGVDDQTLDRLEQMWCAGGECLRHGDASGGPERNLRAVDGVIGTVDQGC